MNSTIANRTSENAYLILWLICIFVLPVSLDAQTGNTDQGGVENSAVQAKSQLVDALIAEISQLIPGKYEPGSKNDELVRGIAKSVVEQNQTKIRLFLDDLIAADSRVPPKDLILAGLAYATNNAVNGQVLLERASTNHPNHPAIDVAFCRLALSQGRNFEALVLANKALKDNQSAKHDEISKHHFDVAILDALTVAQMRRQQIDAAKEYAKQWEAIDPSNDKMLMASGEINFLQNNVNIALEFLNKRSPEVQALTPSEVVIAKWFQSNRDGDNYSKWVTSAFEKHKNNKLAQVEYAAWLLRQENLTILCQCLIPMIKRMVIPTNRSYYVRESHFRGKTIRMLRVFLKNFSTANRTTSRIRICILCRYLKAQTLTNTKSLYK